jgi:hypothetical protein
MTEQTTYPIGDIEVNGRSFPATFNTRGGTFIADVGGRGVGAQTWDELVERVKVEERRTRVKVEVTFIDPATGRKGTATGLHASTRRPLIRWVSGGTSNDEVSSPLRPDTDTVKLAELVAASKAAERALREFRRANELGPYSLSQAVTQAIEKAAAELA